MNKQAWLDQLKVGDKVIVSAHFDRNYISTIERITKTLIIIKQGRFRKDGGLCQGSGWYRREFISEPTKDKLDAIKHSYLYKWCDNNIRHDLTIDQLSRIKEIINE